MIYMKQINPRTVLKRVKDRESDRERVTLYLSKTTYENFRKFCEAEGVTPSKVVEEFMALTFASK